MGLTDGKCERRKKLTEIRGLRNWDSGNPISKDGKDWGWGWWSSFRTERK